MQKWVAAIAYDGATFHGWQKQCELATVQAALEQSLARVADHDVATVCAGRTDKGVHAHAQIVHFYSASDRTEQQWMHGINSYLPKSVRVLGVRAISEDFDARFSATARHYIYAIENTPVANPLNVGRVLWVRQQIDCDLLSAVADSWLGEQDFSSFRDSQCQARHPFRRLLEWKVYRQGASIYIHIVANAFLHHMVRNMVGVGLCVGLRKKPVTWAKEVLAARDRSAADVTVAACGLYLHKVYYPELYKKSLPAVELDLAMRRY